MAARVVCRAALLGMALRPCLGEQCSSKTAHQDDGSSMLQMRKSNTAMLADEKIEEAATFFTQGLPFKEPPEVRSPLTLTVGTVRLCAPREEAGWFGSVTSTDVCWYTRAYGTDKIAPSVPGPTIRVKPGEKLQVLLQNKLKPPNPGPMIISQFYWPNTTSLHTHGLHISGNTGADDVWVHVQPGAQVQYNLDILEYHMGGTHWYHPHSHHSTAIQAGGGLHGALIVDDPPNSLPPYIAKMEEKVMVLSLIDAAYTMHTNGVWGMPLLEYQAGGNLWKNEKGEYINFPEIAVLVNGQYKPRLSIQSGKWYRFRIVFAAVELTIQVYHWFDSDAQCEMQLLAKDGVYLHEAPRAIDKVYLASGNRADVAVRCKCLGKTSCSSHLVTAGTRPEMTLGETQVKMEADLKKFEKKGAFEDGLGNPKFGAFAGISEYTVEQDLLRFDIEDATPEPALASFKVKRPCYLADLRFTEVPKSNQGRIELMNPTDYKLQFAPSLTGGTAQGKSMLTMEEPPIATINVGQVYEWYLRGPQGRSNDKAGLSIHPFHLHVVPYQIVSIESDDPYFMPGDWHDTLLHSSGQALVKLQTNAFTGHMIMHCHILDHEDQGMMTYMQVNGKEGTVWAGAEKADPTCYRKPSGVGFTILPPASLLQSVPRWVVSEQNSNCHAACGNFGGCAVGEASHAELDAALQQLSVNCTSIVDSDERHAPSLLEGGACIRGFSGKGHCGVIAPEGVSRFCRCHGGASK